MDADQASHLPVRADVPLEGQIDGVVHRTHNEAILEVRQPPIVLRARKRLPRCSRPGRIPAPRAAPKAACCGRRERFKEGPGRTEGELPVVELASDGRRDARRPIGQAEQQLPVVFGNPQELAPAGQVGFVNAKPRRQRAGAPAGHEGWSMRRPDSFRGFTAECGAERSLVSSTAVRLPLFTMIASSLV